MSISAILLQLGASGCSILGIFEALLSNPAFQSHPARHDLVENVPDIISLLLQNSATKDKAFGTVFVMTEEKYCDQIQQLSLRESGFHATATRLTEQQLKEFDLQHIMEQLAEKAPDVWRLVGRLLSADTNQNKRRVQNQRRAETEVDDGEIQDELLVSDGEDGQLVTDEGDDEPEDIEDQRREEKDALINIVSTTPYSLMQSLNRATEKDPVFECLDDQHQSAMQFVPSCRWCLSTLLQHSRGSR